MDNPFSNLNGVEYNEEQIAYKDMGGEEKAAARKPAGDGRTAGRKERRTRAADEDAADEPENEPLYEEKHPKKKKSGKDQKNKQDDELDIIDFNDL